MVGLMSPAAYIAADGLVSHQWEEALGPVKALCPSIGECWSYEAGVGGLVSRGMLEGIVSFHRGN